MKWHGFGGGSWRKPSRWVFVLVLAALVITQALVLMAMGHPLICDCGQVDLWHAAASGPETSQHLTDWYSFTHIAHGLLLYLILWLLVPRASFPIILIMALGLEAGWEIVENTPVVIERYRQTALAAGYFGDSVVNSLGDSLAMVFGVLLSRVAPVVWSVLLFLGVEIILAVAIHDNLTLNIIQLIYPLEVISNWQMAV